MHQYRVEANLTLRQFADIVEYDPSNLSKIERGVHPPPNSSVVLLKWAAKLGLEPNSKASQKFVDSGLATWIQKRRLLDDEIALLLPAFCRTIDNKKLDPDTYRRLVNLLRQNA